MFVSFDDATRALVRLAAVVTAGREDAIRATLAQAAGSAPHEWIEELLLQTYLFAGFPRALNAMREWRRLRPEPATPSADARDADAIRADGEETCARVYGGMYERLRANVRELHPSLDAWMITEGYGKVLSRPGLDLARRELCIVSACAAAEQDRQLHSHLHGAINVGVAPAVLDALFDALTDVLTDAQLRSARLLWARVRGK
jgi:4-carboxymuconolactone decarboxylase